MLYLVIVMILILILQVGLFFYIRASKKKWGSTVMDKYDIRSARDAWVLINDPSVPSSDKEQIEVFYRGMLNQ